MPFGEKLLTLSIEYQESLSTSDIGYEHTREPAVIAAEYEATLRDMLAS